MCSPSIDDLQRTLIMEFLGMRAVHTHSKYLGLPTIVGQNRTETFKALEEKLSKSIQDWKNLTLSWAGRETLIKACLQSQFIYAMSCYKLPKVMCERLNARMTSFWWKGGRSDRSIHWSRRDIIHRDKSMGGLGFRFMECFNAALLMKQLWRILTAQDSLVSTVMKQRYFRGEAWPTRKPLQSDSFIWKSIGGIKDMFVSGVAYEDSRWIWKHSFSGEYTVKSGYELAYRWRTAKESNSGEGSRWVQNGVIWNKLWKSKVPEGVKILAWRAFSNALPVLENLTRRGVGDRASCEICGCKFETVNHVFRECWWGRSFWNSVGIDPGSQEESMSDWLWGILEEGNAEVIMLVLLGIQQVWRNRNMAVHGEQGWNISHCKFKVLHQMTQFKSHRLVGFEEEKPEDRTSGDRWEVYCDGSWSREQRRGGWAAIILKNNVLMECRTGTSGEAVTGIQTEINALIMGMQLAEKFRVRRAVFYSDCINAIWSFQSGDGHKGIHSETILVGLRLLKENESWVLRHIFRERNQCADFLARKARLQVWTWNRDDAIPFLPDCGKFMVN